MYVTGLGLQRVCFKIIAELKKPGHLVRVRRLNFRMNENFFRVGTGNLRAQKALGVLIADGLVIKTGGGKYYLDKDKLAEMRTKIGK